MDHDSHGDDPKQRAVETLFGSIVELPSDRQREILAGADVEVRERVEALLAADRESADPRMKSGRIHLGVLDTERIDTSTDDALPPASDDVLGLIGHRIRHYKVIEQLAVGGMGVVYLARDTRLARRIAIKFLLSEDPRLATRFMLEARATAKCVHENIVVIHEVEEYAGRPYMVLEYLEGRTLRQWWRRYSLRAHALGGTPGSEPAPSFVALRPRHAVEMILPVVRALVCAHQLEIVHRDLKPENIVVTNTGSIKVLDFGIAKLLSEAKLSSTDQTHPPVVWRDGETDESTILGTLPYMSPEQWGAGEIDHRSDIWAVGIILAELVLGRHPLAPLSYPRLLGVADVTHRMPSMSTLKPELGTLARIIDRCLLKRSKERLSTALELLELLESLPQRELDGEFAGASAPRLGRLWGVPNPPLHYLARAGASDELSAALLDRDENEGTGIYGLCGMGGIGKTVLAAAVAQSEAARARFPDGIFWLTIGKENRLIRLQTQLAYCLSSKTTAFDNINDGKRWLKNALRDKSVLLVLDDVWELEQATAFDVLDRDGRLLITTCNRQVLALLDAIEKPLEVLSQPYALALLGGWVGTEPDELPPQAAEVAEACGYLPLALSIVGAMVRSRLADWTDVLEFLRQDLEGLEHEALPYPHPNLHRVFEVSVGFMRPEDRRHYIDMAVFPENHPIPEAALQTLWCSDGLSRPRARRLVSLLATRSLVIRDDHDRIRLHSLQRVYVGSQVEDPIALHHRLVEAYRTRCPEGWSTGPDDGYFFQWLPYHLVAAGRSHELASLLWSYDWLEAKLHATSIAELLADFSLLPGDSHQLDLLHDTLRLSSHVLAKDPAQLPGQLLGRLGYFQDRDGPGHGDIIKLVGRAGETHGLPWLRPVRAQLTPPGGPLLLCLSGHSRAVAAVAVTPDGTLAISASDDRTLVVWDLATGSERCVLRGHTGRVAAVAVTPDSRRAISAAHDRTLRIWDLHDGRELGQLAGHEGSIAALAVTPDGKRAISTSWDKTLKVWNLREGTEICTLVGHTGPVLSADVTPDGALAVSASDDRTLRVWDLNEYRPLFTLSDHTRAVTSVAVTPDGERAVSASDDGCIKVWDLGTRCLIATVSGHSGQILGVALTPDGQRAVSASSDRTLKVWDLASGEEVCSLLGHSGPVLDVAVTPDGKRAISASYDRTLRVWDLCRKSEVSGRGSQSRRLSSIVATPDGRRAITAGSDRTLQVWDLENGSELMTLHGHDEEVSAVAVTDDSALVVSASYDRTLRTWEIDSGRQVHTLTGHTELITDVETIPGTERAISASRDRTLRIWDLRTGTMLFTLSGHTSLVSAVVVSTDGKRAVSASFDKTLRVWDLESASELFVLDGHSSIVTAVALAPDGRRAVSASRDQSLKVWDLDRGGELHTLVGHSGLVNAVAVTPDSRRVVSVADDRTVRVWDLDSGRELHTMTGHTGLVLTAALSRDGRYAFTTSYDKTLVAWDLRTACAVAAYSAESPMHVSALSAAEHTIAAGDQFGRVHVLRLTEETTGR